MEEKVVKMYNGQITYMYEGDTDKIVSYTELKNNTTPVKRISFCMKDNFRFYADRFDISDEEEYKTKTEMEVTIDRHNLMYGPLKNMLGGKDYFILKDDYVKNPYERVLRIFDEGKGLRVVFKNDKAYDRHHISRYPILIYGIINNDKSRLDQTEEGRKIKGKLKELFNDFDLTLKPNNRNNKQIEDEER